MPPRKKAAVKSAPRDPERTRRRILAAALKEFSARGFSGARVDAIAARAGANKRMLYHYFGHKVGLFRAVLRHKMRERLQRVESQLPATDFNSTLPLWFKQNCKDVDWVRLLAWESLQSNRNPVLDEKERRRFYLRSHAVLREKQAAGYLRRDVKTEFLQLAKVSLAMFPMALPQVARIILGRSPHDARFQSEYVRFLETIAVWFRP